MEHRTGRILAMAMAAAAAQAVDSGPADVERVPDDLQRLAGLKLREAAMRGDAEARVNVRGNHPLALWSRNRQKEKRKAKIAATSRRRNRK
jgi:hypothetical protein